MKPKLKREDELKSLVNDIRGKITGDTNKQTAKEKIIVGLKLEKKWDETLSKEERDVVLELYAVKMNIQVVFVKIKDGEEYEKEKALNFDDTGRKCILTVVEVFII